MISQGFVYVGLLLPWLAPVILGMVTLVNLCGWVSDRRDFSSELTELREHVLRRALPPELGRPRSGLSREVEHEHKNEPQDSQTVLRRRILQLERALGGTQDELQTALSEIRGLNMGMGKLDKQFRKLEQAKRNQSKLSKQASEAMKQRLKKSELKASSIEDRILCTVCLENERGTMFLPCQHAVACAKCAQSLKKCLVCRAEIKQTKQFILS